MVSTGGPKKDSNRFSALSRVNEFSRQDANGSEAAQHHESHLRTSSSSQAQLNNPLIESIPYLYDTEDSDCSSNLQEQSPMKRMNSRMTSIMTLLMLKFEPLGFGPTVKISLGN